MSESINEILRRQKEIRNEPYWSELPPEAKEMFETAWTKNLERINQSAVRMIQRAWRAHREAGRKPLVQEPEAKKCVLCNSVLETYGNNPAPLAQDGECCDDCNTTKVIPARVAWIKADHEKRVAEFNARNA